MLSDTVDLDGPLGRCCGGSEFPNTRSKRRRGVKAALVAAIAFFLENLFMLQYEKVCSMKGQEGKNEIGRGNNHGDQRLLDCVDGQGERYP